MFLYSKTINSFVSRLRSSARAILREEMGMTLRRSRVEYCGYTIPLHIVIFEDKGRLGYFDSKTYQIGIHKKLMLEAKDEVILNVLRHELAHYITYIKYKDHIKPHGEEFKTICRQFGWGTEVSLAYSNIEFENSKVEANQAELKILSRVKKLLALASSSNQHEAEAATLKANEILFRYNLSLTDSEDVVDNDETVYVKRVLEAKRNNGKLQAIYEILQEFFVQPVFNHGKGICYLEVVGSKLNVEMAEYVALFLDNEIDFLWEQARKQDSFYKGVSKKNSFMRGLALGFIEKLKSSHLSQGTNAVMVLEKALDKKVALVYSRLGHSSSSSTSHCSKASGLGREMGRNMSIRPGVKSSSQTFLLES